MNRATLSADRCKSYIRRRSWGVTDDCIKPWLEFRAATLKHSPALSSSDCANVLLQRYDQQALRPGGPGAAGHQAEAAGGAYSRGWRDGQGQNDGVRVSHEAYSCVYQQLWWAIPAKCHSTQFIFIDTHVFIQISAIAINFQGPLQSSLTYSMNVCLILGVTVPTDNFSSVTNTSTFGSFENFALWVWNVPMMIMKLLIWVRGLFSVSLLLLSLVIMLYVS